MNKIEITGCNECPFLMADDDGLNGMCTHPKPETEYHLLNYTSANGVENYINPDWCPLREESTTIILKK